MPLKVSLLLDGQLERGRVKEVLDQVVSDPALRDRYTVYGIIGDTMRGNPTPDDGFSPRIFDRLRRENVRMEPGYDPLAEE